MERVAKEIEEDERARRLKEAELGKWTATKKERQSADEIGEGMGEFWRGVEDGVMLDIMFGNAV